MPDGAVLIPLCGAAAAALCARRGQRALWIAFISALALSCAPALFAREFDFQSIYSLLAALVFLSAGLFSKEYFSAHGQDTGRYAFFTLLTLSAVQGLIRADNLYTAYVYFEILSFGSYPWVAHSRTREALRAAQTYLAIAVFGGMVTLMGLFLLQYKVGSLSYAALRACALPKSELYLPAALACVGFAAKAGLFPLHVWLPKAHPVAPAPASALLSGVLTKAGVIGLIAVCVNLFPGDKLFGEAFVWLGVITMLLGALKALFSVNLKHTLACSSMSQLGFIAMGLGLTVFLGDQNALAARGTFLHMFNHTVFKLILFLCAGAVHMNVGKLHLNAIKGYGRGKPLFRILFLCGALGIAGVPLFSGYLSKSLLHEALLEAVAEGRPLFRLAEGIFLFSGGLTFAYMLKLYKVLFLDHGEGEKVKRCMNSLSTIAVLPFALAIPVLGVFAGPLMTYLADAGASFLRGGVLEGGIAWFSLENIKGAAESLLLGSLAYLCVVRGLMLKKGEYLDCWPAWLDLEESLYRPVYRALTKALCAVCRACARLSDCLYRPAGIAALPRALAGVSRSLSRSTEFLYGKIALRAFPTALGFTARALDEGADGGALLLRRTILRKRPRVPRAYLGSRFTYLMGEALNLLVALLNKTILRKRPSQADFIVLLAAWQEEARDAIRRLFRSVSFGLILLCLGLALIISYLLNA